MVRPQNNPQRNNDLRAKKRTYRNAETAAYPITIKIVHGVKTQSPQIFAGAGRIFRTVTAFTK